MQTTARSLFSHLNGKEGLQKAAAKFLLCRGSAGTCLFMPEEDLDKAARSALNKPR